MIRKNIFKDCDKSLLFTSIVLCLFGLFNIVTVSSQEVTNTLGLDSIYYYFWRQLLFIVIGVVGALIIMNIPIKKIYKFLPILFVIIVVLNFYVILIGTFTRGASNWFKIGPFSIQPSELSKPIIILFTAFLFEKFAKRFKNPRLDNNIPLFIIFGVGLLVPILVFLQKDMGTCAIITFTFLTMLLFSPISKKDKIQSFKVLLITGLAVGFVFMLAKGSLLTGAQASRLNYFNPCQSDKYMHGGYQVCNAFIAINRGNLTGVGVGKSTQKYSYIPEPHTDMVFAIISEEYGYLIGLVIILAYFFILYRILKLASYASTISGRFICLGVATYIFLHIAINLGGMFGIIPLTGVPIPFLSYGGSFVISLIVSIALVERVHIDTKRAKMI